MPAGPVQAVPPPPPAATEPKQVPRPPHLDRQPDPWPGPSPPARALFTCAEEEAVAYEGLEGLQIPGGSALPALRCLLVAKGALLEQWFSKCGPRTISITWEFIRNARPKY